MNPNANPFSPILTIAVALNCEAKPWIDSYGLKKTADRPFAYYSNSSATIELVVSGIGALAMSTAVGWLAGMDQCRHRVWLNLGIAGHGQREIGQLLRVHSVIDAIDSRQYYLSQTARWSGEIDALMSVNAPSNSYPEKAMIDMEGFAFFKSASMFSSSEFIASLKVISDNSNHNADQLNANKISQLMLENKHTVLEFCDGLIELAEAVLTKSSDQMLESHFDNLKMSFSQRQRLQRLLDKAVVLGVSDDDFPDREGFVGTTALLDEFENRLNSVAPAIRPTHDSSS